MLSRNGTQCTYATTRRALISFITNNQRTSSKLSSKSHPIFFNALPTTTNRRQFSSHRVQFTSDAPESYFNENIQKLIRQQQKKDHEEAAIANENDPKEAERRLKEKLGLPDYYERNLVEMNQFELQREQTLLNLVDKLLAEVPLSEEFLNEEDALTSFEDEKMLSEKIKGAYGMSQDDIKDREALAARLAFDQSQTTIKEANLAKFYKSLSIHPHMNVTPDGEKGFVVRIGAEQLLRSPSGRVVVFPNKHLAAAVIGEWELQRGYLRPTTMPLTDLVGQWQDMKAEVAEGLVSNFGRLAKRTIVGFFDSEFICLRQDFAKSKATLELIQQLWDPIVQWFEQEYGTKLNIAGPDSDFSDDYIQNEAREAFVKRYTSEENMAQFREIFIDWVTGVDLAYLLLDKLTPAQLITLYAGTQITKSVLISTALMHNQLDYKKAMAASQLLLRQQVKNYGLVEGEHDVLFAEEASRLAALELFKALAVYENK